MECRNFYVGDGEHQSPVAGVPSHSSHEIWLIRRNGAHYLSIFRRPLAEALVRGGAVSGVKAIASAMRAFRALRGRLPRSEMLVLAVEQGPPAPGAIERTLLDYAYAGHGGPVAASLQVREP